jgi:hypothetical protein
MLSGFQKIKSTKGIDHGKSNSMGNVSHDGEGKGEKRKEINSNGLL